MDREQFGREMAALRPYLLHMAIRSSRTHAEDIVQEAYLRAWKSRETFDGSRNMKAWMGRVLVTCSIDWSRAHKGDEKAVAFPQFVPAREIVDMEISDWLAQAIKRLPEKYRFVVELVVLRGMPQAQAAGILSVAEGTIKSRLSRACGILRRKRPKA